MLAASMGRAVIAPACGCLPEQLGDGAMLYDPLNPEGLSEVLRECVTLDLDAVGRRARRAVVDYGWDHVAAMTREVYDRALLGREPGRAQAVPTP